MEPVITILVFCCGALFSTTAIILTHMYNLYNKSDRANLASADGFKQELEKLAETHNNLTTAMAIIDKKVSDTSLRLDMLQSQNTQSRGQSAQGFFNMKG